MILSRFLNLSLIKHEIKHMVFLITAFIDVSPDIKINIAGWLYAATYIAGQVPNPLPNINISFSGILRVSLM